MMMKNSISHLVPIRPKKVRDIIYDSLLGIPDSLFFEKEISSSKQLDSITSTKWSKKEFEKNV